jgi:hypothetical protein
MLGKWGPPASHPALPQSTGQMAIFYRLAPGFDDVGCPQTFQLKSIIYIYIMNGILPPNFLQIYQYLSYVIGKAVPNPNPGSRSWMLGSRAMWLPGPGFFKKSGMIYFVYTYW